MKIISVETENIRQFSGKQKIAFSVDPKRNVTLVHGPNTSGKTTFLNAINWCFYGNFLSGFNDPDRLISENALGEYSVTVNLDHEQREYIVVRKSMSRPSESTLTVLVKERDGRVVPHPQPQLLINRILPESLAPFFFFAGEMIKDGRSAFQSNRGTAEAIRAVLGFTIVEAAIEDLNFLLKKKNSELASLTKGTDLGDMTADLIRREEQLALKQVQLTNAYDATSIFEARRLEIHSQLRGLESSSALQQRRDHAERKLATARSQLDSARRAWRELIASHGHSLFWRAIAEKSQRFISEAITRKRIPSPYDKTFVSDILKDGKCICGRSVDIGSNEFRCVSALINDATDEQTLRRAMSVRGTAEKIIGLFENAPRNFGRAADVLHSASENVESFEQELERIRDLIRRNENSNAATLEQELEDKERELVNFKANIKNIEWQLEQEKSQIVDLKKQIDRVAATTPQIDEVKVVIDVLDQLVTSLEEELESAQSEGIAVIQSALNHVVENFTRQKYIAHVAKDFSVTLYRHAADGSKQKVVVLSSGERRLVDLCFVSALVKVCRQRESQTGGLLVPGATAPLIVDAPFGELDPEYRELAVTTMMDLSEQLVLLLSKTHWEHIDKALRPRLGEEWLLTAYHQSPAGRASEVSVIIEGQRFQQMFYGQNENKTLFTRVGMKKDA